MGQNHSQPANQPGPAPVLPSPTTDPVSSPNGDVPTPEPRRRTLSATHRKRLSTFFKGNRSSLIEPIDELGRREDGPSTSATIPPTPSTPGASNPRVPALTVKSRSSIRRLFQRRSVSMAGATNDTRQPAPTSGSLARSSTPPKPAIGTSRSQSRSDSSEEGQTQSNHATASQADAQMFGGPSTTAATNGKPSEITPPPIANNTLSSTPPPSSFHTAASEPPSSSSRDGQSGASSTRVPTKREIAMLSGTDSSDASATKATTSPPTPVPEALSLLATPLSKHSNLEEDPAALPISRSTSWRSQRPTSSHDIPPLDLAGADDLSHHRDVGDADPSNDGAGLWPDMETNLATPTQDRTIDPASTIADPGSSAAPTRSHSTAYQPPSPVTDAVSQIASPPSSVAHHASPVVIPPPLPIIPAGTTMIIQGVVQAAEDGGRVRRNPDTPGRATPSATPNEQENGSADTPPSNSNRPASTSPNAHAHLSGTFGDDNAEDSNAGNDDSPGGAADLLGALLIAAASATANMLLSDPPGASAGTSPNGSSSPQSASGASTSANSTASQNAEPSSSVRARSSVGTGPRPRPNTIAVRNDETASDFFTRDRARPRSLVGSLRDRLLGTPSYSASRAEEAALDRLLRALPVGDRGRRASHMEVPQEEPETPPTDPARDPIESLRERIANELMRALAARESGSADLGLGIPSSGADARSGPSRDPSSTSPLSPHSPEGLSALPLSVPAALSARPGGVVHPEGSFERFLHDTNAELRSTLVERMNFRDRATAVPIPVIPPPPEATSSNNAAVDEDSAVPSDPAAAVPAVRLVNRPPEGVIEPRLNWWRMHRFPPRTVAAQPGDSPPTPQPPSTNSMPTTPFPSIPNPVSSNTTDATPPVQPNSAILIPVIVVGIRTAPSILVQEIGALAATRPPDDIHTATTAGATSSTLPPLGGSNTPPIHPLGSPDRNRPWARAVDSITRAIATRRRMAERERDRRPPVHTVDSFARINEILAPSSDAAAASPPDANAPRDRTRNYLIWVIGGYYPETHPILTSPNLLLNQFDQDDFWGLAELLGQVKPPVASKADIERAGLQIIKSSQLAEYGKEGRVTSNTSERCLICLSDYEPEEDLRIMACKHVFHQECVDKWLEVGRNNCPACRTKGVDVAETPQPASDTAGPSTAI